MFQSTPAPPGPVNIPGALLHPPLNEDEEDGLPRHSNSMVGEQQQTGGWKGFFLASSSRCFDDELCFAVIDFCSVLNEQRRGWCGVDVVNGVATVNVL